MCFFRRKKSDCKCEKYGDVKDGYQYCLQCNRAIKAPAKPKCTQHLWQLLETHDCRLSLTNFLYGRIFISRCENCGEIKKEEFKVDKLEN